MVYSESKISSSGYGRPRDLGASERIFDAVEWLFVDGGYAGVTFGSVARRAGVGVKTIYRRFRNRDELILGTIEVRVGMPSFGNSGDTVEDLVSMLGAGGRASIQRYRVRFFAAVALESGRHPEFLMVLPRRFVWPLRRSLESVLVRAVRRGEVGDDVDLRVVIDLLMGFSGSRFWSGEDFDDVAVRISVGLVLRGVGYEVTFSERSGGVG